MKNLILALAASLASASLASADGFVCVSRTQDLKVQVYNQVQPDAGTRNAATMVLSNPNVSLGRKTIAKFSSDSLLTNQASTYVANVDLRFTDSDRKGELIAGTKLGNVDTITLQVDFTYATPLALGSTVEGLLTIDRRSGSPIQVDMECERYLKN